MLLKMCHYVSVVRKVEILQMTADFFVDANDKVWFFFAKDIVWRYRKLSNGEVQQINNARIEMEEQQALLRAKLSMPQNTGRIPYGFGDFTSLGSESPSGSSKRRNCFEIDPKLLQRCRDAA